MFSLISLVCNKDYFCPARRADFMSLTFLQIESRIERQKFHEYVKKKTHNTPQPQTKKKKKVKGFCLFVHSVIFINLLT